MRKFLSFIILSFIMFTSPTKAGSYGEGDLQLAKHTVEAFIKHIRSKGNNKPADFYVTLDGQYSVRWFCGHGVCKPGNLNEDIKDCERRSGKKCHRFAFQRTIRWKNGINPGKGKASRINSKWSDAEIFAKLNELGFYNNNLNVKKEEPKKKEAKKIVKKYDAKGERSIALSWTGYDDLIAGTVKFDEKNYKGILNLTLPNNDGDCDGTYSLQEDGKGTWQIACSNSMGAAGTLKWMKDGGVTGIGRDHDDKKVKFTVSKKN